MALINCLKVNIVMVIEGIDKKKVAATVENLAKQRVKAQQLFLNFEPLRENFLKNGLTENGVDENGNIKKTKPLSSLGIKIYERNLKNGKPYPKKIIIRFKRENIKLMNNIGFLEIERRMKKGKEAPKKYVFVSTDIFSAVRLCKHLRESYKKEIDSKNQILEELEKMNSEMNALILRGKVKKEEVMFFIEALSSYSKVAVRWRSAEKFLAKEYLNKTIEFLQKSANTHNGKEKTMFLAGACAKLTALRNRLGEWRDKGIGKLLAWNDLRECALRAKRDFYLKSLVEEYIILLTEERKAFSVLHSWRTDLWFLGHIAIIKEAAEQKIGYPILRELLKEFYLCAKGTNIETNIVDIAKTFKVDYESGLRKLDSLSVFLSSKNPWYVLEQLEKTADPYLSSFMEHFKNALKRLENNDVWRAKASFKEALSFLD
ncbi:MAG: hypothetical protein QXI17_01970 [Candidatus Bilamarchaeaceae archaeon]